MKEMIEEYGGIVVIAILGVSLISGMFEIMKFLADKSII